MPVEIAIEQLVLHGINLTPVQRSLLNRAITDELTRLLAAGGAGSFDGGAVPSVRAPDITLRSPFDPVDTGTGIARAVYGGINGGQTVNGA